MQIILNQDEIMEAVKEMVHSQISINDDQEVEVSFDTDDDDNTIARIEIFRSSETRVEKPVASEHRQDQGQAPPEEGGTPRSKAEEPEEEGRGQG